MLLPANNVIRGNWSQSQGHPGLGGKWGQEKKKENSIAKDATLLNSEGRGKNIIFKTWKKAEQG